MLTSVFDCQSCGPFLPTVVGGGGTGFVYIPPRVYSTQYAYI